MQTIGTSEAEIRAQTAAAKVAEGLRELDSAGINDVEMTDGDLGGQRNGVGGNGADGSAGAGDGEGNSDRGVEGEHMAPS